LQLTDLETPLNSFKF